MSSVALAVQNGLTPDQMNLIKATVAKNATTDELGLFLYRCKMMGLDPLKPGHIHFVKYGNNPGTIIIGIDGFRSRAAATGKHTGTKRGVIRNDKGECIGAWCEVYRSDWTQPAREEVSLAEYNTGKAQWAKMPETMIKKVAEVAALRMAFPDDLGGLYSDDEMAQAEASVQKNPLQEIRDAKVAAEENPEDYIVTFGKFKGQRLGDIDIYQVNSYCEFIVNSAVKDGKEIKGQVAEFLEKAQKILDKRDLSVEAEAL